MTLSEKIISLRTTYNMSQGDLAEKLNVSRQSVSKWETGASIPDLEKLIAMSELFSITLDELVKGDSITNDLTNPQNTPQPQIIYVQPPSNPFKTNGILRIAVFLLLLTGILCCLLGFLTPLGIVFIIAGIICFMTLGFIMLFVVLTSISPQEKH
ncbi:MAG: helix-turn-helix domain-containing protein [Agathobacter sp.]|nr:helix-turn-helix domain-containing protein [Agathobacter sp.]